MTAGDAVTVKGGPWPRVSLVTPSYNAGGYIRQAIESVLDQGYPNLEYLVMDGGSTDDTLAILREFGAGLRWVSAPDDGQADAIARGLEQTSGNIIGWLNADDVLKPGAIHAAVAALQDNPAAALVYGNADFIDAAGQVIAPCTVVEPYSQHRLVHYGDYIIQPAAFFSRAAYVAVGGLDRSLNWAMDWDLWIRLARAYPVVHIEPQLASYRWLGSNKTAEGGFARLREVEMVAGRYGCRGLPAYFRLERARLHAEEARHCLRERQFLAMLGSLGQAATTILTSRRATTCLASRHVWRNYRTARKLARHVGASHAECR